MSRLHLIIAFSVALAAFALVAGADRSEAAQGAAQTSDQRVEPFSQVAFALPGELMLVQTNDPVVSIAATPEQLEAIEVIAEEGVLHIKKHKQGWMNRVDLSDVQVRVGYQTIAALRIAGSGNAIADAIDSDDFALTISGSGDAVVKALSCQHAEFKVAGSGDIRVVQLDAQTTATKISGSGDIVLTGTAPAQKLSIAGSGDYDASELNSTEATLKIAGSGSATVRASDRISGSVVGSGDVYYYGDPELALRVTGSGGAEKRSDTL